MDVHMVQPVVRTRGLQPYAPPTGRRIVVWQVIEHPVCTVATEHHRTIDRPFGHDTTVHPKVGSVVEIQLYACGHGQCHSLSHGKTIVHHNRTSGLQQSIGFYHLATPHIGILPHGCKNDMLLHPALQSKNQGVVQGYGGILPVFGHRHLCKNPDTVSRAYLEIVCPRPAFRLQIGTVHIHPKGSGIRLFQTYGRNTQAICVTVVNHQLARARPYGGNHSVEPHRIGGKG